MSKIIVLLCFALPLIAQNDTVQLLRPTGAYHPGTVTYEWIDTFRTMSIGDGIKEKRTLIVQLWYPSKPDSTDVPSPYSALSQDYQNTLTHSNLRARFSDDVDKCPLILIAPGRGTERYLYTTLAEELSSHGYVVASVDLPEIGYVLYQDGYILKPSSEFKPPRGMMAGPYEKVDSFFERPTDMGVRDLAFVLKNIDQLNEYDPNGRFTGRIDMNNIGVFGHSLGGRIAGALTAYDNRIKALAAMEGIPPREVRFEGKIKVPSLMLCSSSTFPYAESNYKSFIDNRKAEVFMVLLKDFGHNSLTDNPYIYPSYFNYPIDPVAALDEGRNILLDFFNVYLGKMTGFSEKVKTNSLFITDHYK